MKYGIALILVTFAMSASAFADEAKTSKPAPEQQELVITAPETGSETATYAYTTEAVVEFPQSALIQ